MQLDPEANNIEDDLYVSLNNMDSFKTIIFALTAFSKRTQKSVGVHIASIPEEGGVRVQLSLPDKTSKETYQELMTLLQKSQDLFDVQAKLNYAKENPDGFGDNRGHLEIEAEALARSLRV